MPLQAGGSNDATNLWPEVGKPSGNPKDKVENALDAAVCDGRVSLAAAQQAIASDWLTAEKRLGIGGVVSGTPAPASRPWCTASAAPANDRWAGDYDVYVKSNQPDRDATASDANDTWSYDTNGSGAATIYLWYTSPGDGHQGNSGRGGVLDGGLKYPAAGLRSFRGHGTIRTGTPSCGGLDKASEGRIPGFNPRGASLRLLHRAGRPDANHHLPKES